MIAAAHDSPFIAFLNPTTQEWRDGYVRFVLDLRPDLLNRSGVVHGGVLSTLVDLAGGFTGLHCAVPGNKRYGMTLSLTTSFLAQTSSGHLVAIGERQSSGRKIFFANVAIRGGDGVLIATGSGVYRYRSGSESPEGVPARD